MFKKCGLAGALPMCAPYTNINLACLYASTGTHSATTTEKPGIRNISLLPSSLVVDPTAVAIWAYSSSFIQLNRNSIIK